MHVHINYNINHQFVYQLLHLPIGLEMKLSFETLCKISITIMIHCTGFTKHYIGPSRTEFRTLEKSFRFDSCGWKKHD